MNDDEIRYDVPMDDGLMHVISIIMLIIMPISSIIGAVRAVGIQGLVSPRFLLLVPMVAILAFWERWARNVAYVDVSAIEEYAPAIVVVEKPMDKLSTVRPARPKRVRVSKRHDADIMFHFVLRSDWDDNKYHVHDGVIVSDGTNAAVLIPDDL